MNNIEQVDAIRAQMTAEGAAKPDIIRQLALACIGWPYVFGAWGEECTPSGRKRRARSEHPTIVSACQVLSGKASDCTDCKWFPGGVRVRMFDWRGFTRWVLQQVGLDITGQGATSQYNTASNWVKRGKIDELPDCVCCLFRKKGSSMEHTGMHLGGGVVVDCSVNVRSVGMKGWTHYAIPVGLYSEEEIPVETVRPTLRRGSRGTAVVELQEILNMCGYDCGAVDGIFGTRTFNALVAFQTEAKLDPDGVCGPKTWSALATAEAQAPMAPPTPDQVKRYRVTCEGVTWQQYREIMKICPLAEAVEESD